MNLGNASTPEEGPFLFALKINSPIHCMETRSHWHELIDFNFIRLCATEKKAEKEHR